MCKWRLNITYISYNYQVQAMDEQSMENQEKMAGLITQKADLEGQMKEMEERLLDEEDAVADLEATKRKMDTEIQDLRADVEDLEQSLSKVDMLLLMCSKSGLYTPHCIPSFFDTFNMICTLLGPDSTAQRQYLMEFIFCSVLAVYMRMLYIQ